MSAISVPSSIYQKRTISASISPKKRITVSLYSGKMQVCKHKIATIAQVQQYLGVNQ